MTMTVKELIEKLQELPEEMEVFYFDSIYGYEEIDSITKETGRGFDFSSRVDNKETREIAIIQ